MDNDFLYMKDLPDPKNNPEFWAVLDSKEHKRLINFLILNRLRGLDPTAMNDLHIRSELSKLKQLQELLDAMESFKTQLEEPVKNEDELTEQ